MDVFQRRARVILSAFNIRSIMRIQRSVPVSHVLWHLSLTRHCRELGALLLALIFLASGARAQSAAATTTSLAISSGGQAITTIRQGTMVTLTATVQLAGAAAAPGQVNFCVWVAPSPPATLPCTDIHLLAKVQFGIPFATPSARC